MRSYDIVIGSVLILGFIALILWAARTESVDLSPEEIITVAHQWTKEMGLEFQGIVCDPHHVDTCDINTSAGIFRLRCSEKGCVRQ